MDELGFNYRLTDLQCALGINQLRKLPHWIARREAIADRYDRAFSELHQLRVPCRRPETTHGWHLYSIQLVSPVCRDDIFRALRAQNIGANVHYTPVYLHPFYRSKFGYQPGIYPAAERAANRILTLPIFPGMSDTDVDDVISAVRNSVAL